ncbi:serine/threonine-protein kinase pim-2-like [Plectropomus leopardus]|uniref:serine/threonine-protein kinase pim-2-like n=1 Tax=Plectropomus leopardus TaxID=160734 RepID=UPI001C4CBA82|nr:serine/threonine-protein kinase pim-2-like [Plectropomus leopardus]
MISSDSKNHPLDLSVWRSKPKEPDVAESHKNAIRGNVGHSSDPCNDTPAKISMRKRSAADEGHIVPKRWRCWNFTDSFRQSDEPAEGGKRKANINTSDPSTVKAINCQLGSRKRKANSDSGVSVKRERHTDSLTEPSATESSLNESSSVKSSSFEFSPFEFSSSEFTTKIYVKADCTGVEISKEEEKLCQLASCGNTSREDFKRKYKQLGQIGKGGFGSVFAGFRRADSLPVAIKHISYGSIRRERVKCNGNVYNIIVEVALMLKTAGLPGSVTQSAAVSLLDWYVLGSEVILIMEKPDHSQDLNSYLQTRRGSLSEEEAKVILKQLVDAAIEIHSNGVFHRDIKPHNVLIQDNFDGKEPRMRVIDFGCGALSWDGPFSTFSGTMDFAPPEYFEKGTYWAQSTTVWQLGAIFYEMLSGHKYFTTINYITGQIKVNGALSADVKMLLNRCLARNPAGRATLEDMQRFLA